MDNKIKRFVKEEEVDRALLILTDSIRRLNDYLNVRVGDTAKDLFYKMSDARGQVDKVANEARLLFQECLERCLDNETKIPKPTIKWERDEYNNIIKINTYKNRPPCEICGETRKVEFCHIIPRQLGGSNRETNVIYLCSTHHSCFDKGVLTEGEWKSISWNGRSEIVKSFVSEVFLKRQQDYWRGNKVPADLVFHAYKPLNNWVKKHLKCNSTNEWCGRRKNVKKIGNGKSHLG